MNTFSPFSVQCRTKLKFKTATLTLVIFTRDFFLYSWNWLFWNSLLGSALSFDKEGQIKHLSHVLSLTGRITFFYHNATQSLLQTKQPINLTSPWGWRVCVPSVRHANANILNSHLTIATIFFIWFLLVKLCLCLLFLATISCFWYCEPEVIRNGSVFYRGCHLHRPPPGACSWSS